MLRATAFDSTGETGVFDEGVTRPHTSEARLSGRVLLVEDNAVSQKVGMLMLERLGLHVDVVADGESAVQSATATAYVAILMDCQLPVLDGLGATRHIRLLPGPSSHAPIVAVTASASESARDRCLAAGMDDVITKPFSLSGLASVLSRWILEGASPTAAATPLDKDIAAGADTLAEPPADLAVLDAEVLDRLERLGEAAGQDLVGRLTSLLLPEAAIEIALMQVALASGDSAAVMRSAHTLCGSSGNLGATELSLLCGALASDGAAGDFSRGMESLEAIQLELGRVSSALLARGAQP